ncbi:GNAT family N-acetyltransferase [Streptomyces sp. NPDC047999]|uniref:GNAT family N-acetyltransferase n=1 Tax=unclassified Streptomyces TaxID=2593676 RepID=UPI00371D709A
MDPIALRDAYDLRVRRGPATAPGVRRFDAEEEGWCGVVWSDLDAHTADAAIAGEVRRAEALGRDTEWKLYDHDLPADLGDRLRRAGFVPEPPETLMIAETAALDTCVRLPEGVRLVDVRDADGVDLAIRAHDAAFGGDGEPLRARLLHALETTPGDLTLTVALAEGGLPVSAARIEYLPGTGFAGLWGGGTHPGWRGRGIYRALVAHRARAAAARGVSFLQVDASEESRPILRRLGFAAVATTTPYVLRARRG